MLLLVLGKVKKKNYFNFFSSSLLVSVISFEYSKRICFQSYFFSPFCFSRMMILFVSVVIMLLLKS